MASFFSIFTLTNLLVISLALNLSLILRIYENTENQEQSPSVISNNEDPASQRTLLSVSSLSVEDDIDRVINLNQGDPTMYEKYWMKMGKRTTVVIPGWQSMSYFSDFKNLCWFLEPELAKQVIRLHKAVGNAVTEGRHIVVGTGSSQLIMAALFALSPKDGYEPISVVSTAPYYSSYPAMSSYLKSGLYKWAGDAKRFNKEGPYIELVTSPNNPDGFIRSSMVNRTGGMLVHDLAYYWPQYTPITSPVDHDLSLFTVTKATGHAGTRIGWALVKDEGVAKKMVNFIELNTIGVSRDSQLRAATILEVITSTTEKVGSSDSGASFFEVSYYLLAERWRQLRAAVSNGSMFSLPEFAPGYCNSLQQETQPQPAFAWLRCEEDAVEDCESFFRGHNVLTRGGSKFGVSPKYVRISMVERDTNFRWRSKTLGEKKVRENRHNVDVEELQDASIHQLPHARHNPRRPPARRKVHGLRPPHEPRPRRLRGVPQAPSGQGQEDQRGARGPPHSRHGPPPRRRGRLHDRGGSAASGRVPGQSLQRRRHGRTWNRPRRRERSRGATRAGSAGSLRSRSRRRRACSGDDAASDFSPADELSGGAGAQAAWSDGWISRAGAAADAERATAVDAASTVCSSRRAASVSRTSTNAVCSEANGTSRPDDEGSTTAWDARSSSASSWDASTTWWCSCLWTASRHAASTQLSESATVIWQEHVMIKRISKWCRSWTFSIWIQFSK